MSTINTWWNCKKKTWRNGNFLARFASINPYFAEFRPKKLNMQCHPELKDQWDIALSIQDDIQNDIKFFLYSLELDTEVLRLV